MKMAYQIFDPADPAMSGRLLKYRPDAAFIALHGPGGEDGRIQGFLDTLRIPYVGSNVDASAICMNKLYTKWVFEAIGIPTPRWALVDPYAGLPGVKSDISAFGRSGQGGRSLKTDISRFLPPFPAVAKPLTEGSSVGVEFLDSAEDLKILLEKRKIPLLVEERISGRELTLPVMGDPMRLLPVIEIRPKAQFFDFDAKYTKGMTEYICPADISPELREYLSAAAERICGALQIRHLCRMDLMLGPPGSKMPALPGMNPGHIPEGNVYFLEINTIPGLTETSLLPMSARAAGIDFIDLIRKLLDSAGAGS